MGLPANIRITNKIVRLTKSLLVAAFFASYNYDTLKDKEGCIWVFRPAQLNEIEGLGNVYVLWILKLYGIY